MSVRHLATGVVKGGGVSDPDRLCATQLGYKCVSRVSVLSFLCVEEKLAFRLRIHARLLTNWKVYLFMSRIHFSFLQANSVAANVSFGVTSKARLGL